jgi:hypothetical protein
LINWANFYGVKFEDFYLDPSFDEGTIDTYKNFFKEIWEDNEYERFDVSIESGDIVVDCGGSIGLFAKFASKRGASEVYSFEQYEHLTRLLDINTRNENLVVPVNGLISHIPGDNNYSLEKIFQEFGLETIDFLKVDIEGFEYDLFQNTSSETFKKIRKISMEVHAWGVFPTIYEPSVAVNYAKAFIDLIEKLSISGYSVHIQRIHSNSCLYMLYAKQRT